MLNRLLNLFRNTAPAATPRQTVAAPRVIRARYDAAQTTLENASHWAWADALSPNAANQSTQSPCRD